MQNDFSALTQQDRDAARIANVRRAAIYGLPELHEPTAVGRPYPMFPQQSGTESKALIAFKALLRIFQ